MLPDDDEPVPDASDAPDPVTDCAEDPADPKGAETSPISERLPPPRFGDPQAIRLYGRRRRS